MKKIILLGLSGVMVASAVMAEDVLEQDNQEQIVVEKSPFDGIYLGAGIGGSFLQNKANGIMKKQNVNRFIGDIYAGYGKVINEKLYLGVEALIEISSAKKNDAELTADARTKIESSVTSPTGPITDKKISVEVKNKAVAPELALKVGYVAGNNMFYAKGGLSFPRTEVVINGSGRVGTPVQEFHYTEVKKINKVAPVVYLGVARAFGNRWNANVEAGYQFAQKKDGIKVNGGWKVRAGVARTFSF